MTFCTKREKVACKMPQVINATHARESFSDIINQVVYGGVEFIVQRQGRPVVRISRVEDKPTPTQKLDGVGFLNRLSGYRLQDAPTDFARNHDQYTWQ